MSTNETNTLDVIASRPYGRLLFDISKVCAESANQVKVCKGDYCVGGKSILGLMALGIDSGDIVTFHSVDRNVLTKISKMFEVTNT